MVFLRVSSQNVSLEEKSCREGNNSLFWEKVSIYYIGNGIKYVRGNPIHIEIYHSHVK